MFLMMSLSTARSLASALDSAFFRRRVMYCTDFAGQRPIHIVSNMDLPEGRRHTLCRLELLGLRSTTDTTRKPSKGDDLLVILNIGKVGVRLLQVQS